MANTDKDRLAKTLSFEKIESKMGFARARGVASDEYLNGLDIAHGGFLFALADYASALASNTDDVSAVSASSSINFISPCPANVSVIAQAQFSYANNKTAICDVKLFDENSAQIYAIFQTRMIFKKFS